MSVVAYDGKFLMADRGACCGDAVVRGQKIFKLDDGRVAAFVGTVSTMMHCLAWLKQGMKESEWPAAQATDDFCVIIVADKGKLSWYERSPYPADVVDKFAAWGSGSEFALGALAAGASAKRAVEITCQLSRSCAFGAEGYQVKGRP